MSKTKIEQILTDVGNMTVVELNELVEAMAEKFGVSAAAPMAMSGGATGDAQAEEKTEFEVILSSVGSSKIGVIKAVRTALNLGLKEAKTLVDGVPASVATKVSKDKAEELKKQLEEAGASVEVK